MNGPETTDHINKGMRMTIRKIVIADQFLNPLKALVQQFLLNRTQSIY